MTGTGSDVTGSDPQTGSDVFWNGKPLSSWKKGSWAQEEAKPRRKRGLKVQSPILGRGVGIIGGPSDRQTVDQLISYLTN